MKRLKLGKAFWLALVAGVFLIMLAGLGITRSQQVQEEEKLQQEIDSGMKNLQKLQVTGLTQQLDDLKRKLAMEKERLAEVKGRLDRTVVSADVVDELFAIADYCGVTVMAVNMSPVQASDYHGVSLLATTLSASATGALDSIISFVVSLNNDFTTGVMRSFSISLPAPEEAAQQESLPVVTLQMTIYSYEEAP
ncbi:MAG: hypothetical protein N2506_06835 [Dehalococcoidales bacterium]|nr:hypothetical protein [Dehalococcoidales bacterium]